MEVDAGSKVSRHKKLGQAEVCDQLKAGVVQYDVHPPSLTPGLTLLLKSLNHVLRVVGKDVGVEEVELFQDAGCLGVGKSGRDGQVTLVAPQRYLERR